MATKLVVLQSCGVALEVNSCSEWTNVVCLSMGMLIVSMMDVVIISAKLVCHLCFVCKLNYLFWCTLALWWCYNNISTPMCQRYGPGVPAPPVYMTTAKLSAQQPSKRRPARADAINQRGDQGKPRHNRPLWMIVRINLL